MPHWLDNILGWVGTISISMILLYMVMPVFMACAKSMVKNELLYDKLGNWIMRVAVIGFVSVVVVMLIWLPIFIIGKLFK